MATKEAGKALGEALAANSVLKELDVSNSTWTERVNYQHVLKGDGPGFAMGLAAGVSANRALTSLNMSNNQLVQRVLKAGKHSWDDDAYDETDMTGTRYLLASPQL